jgi:hypothetical protein
MAPQTRRTKAKPKPTPQRTPTRRTDLPPRSPESKVGKKKAPPPVDEIGYSSDEVEDYSDSGSFASVNTGVSSKASTSSATRNRIALHVEKSFAEDVRDNGGIYGFDKGKTQGLSYLLENSKNSEVYGKRGDEIRVRLGQNVKYFRKNPAAYKKRRQQLGVPFSAEELRVEKQLRRDFSSPANSRSASFQEDHDVSDLEDSFAASVNITPS